MTAPEQLSALVDEQSIRDDEADRIAAFLRRSGYSIATENIEKRKHRKAPR